MPLSLSAARPLGLALGVLADVALADPRRLHPVAGFGHAVSALERQLYADAVRPGAVHTAVAVGTPWLVGFAAERATAGRPWARTLVTAAATWVVLGGMSLAREGVVMAGLLDGARTADDPDGEALAAARQRLTHLCARDPSAMAGPGLARATVESLAENTSDAAVAPLLWGAVAGVPGLLAYRATNTLDAMVGYTSPRYLRFGRAGARLDDLVNLVPARVTALLMVASAPLVGGSARAGWRVLRRDGARHPSPNAGRPEAAAAGVLGVELGGENVYAGRVEHRPRMGAGEGGRAPGAEDVRRAVRLGRVVTAEAAALAVAVAWLVGRRRGGIGG